MRSGSREGLEPVCPFCRTNFERPKTIVLNAMESVLGGTCGACGAIYIVDPTSKNVGEVMMQALRLAAEKLSKDMSELVAGEDYEDAELRRTDTPLNGHQPRVYGQLRAALFFESETET